MRYTREEPMQNRLEANSLQGINTQEPPAIVRLVEIVAEQVEQAIKDEQSPEFSAVHGAARMTEKDLFVKMANKVLDKNRDSRLQNVERDTLIQAIRDVLDRKQGSRPWKNQPQ